MELTAGRLGLQACDKKYRNKIVPAVEHLEQ